MRTLVVHCHPNPESFSAALHATACAALRKGGGDLRVIDLYAQGFDPVMKRDERVAYIDNPGLIEARVQPHVDALRWAEHLVFVYPVWYHGPPAMLKGWLERVFLPGVAFSPATRKGDKTAPGLRHVRRLTVVTTSGAPHWWLWVVGNPNRRLFTRAIRGLCARACRVTWLQLTDMNNVTAQDRSAFLERVARKLEALR
jgi:putative NADPH-quinone reductase